MLKQTSSIAAQTIPEAPSESENSQRKMLQKKSSETQTIQLIVSQKAPIELNKPVKLPSNQSIKSETQQVASKEQRQEPKEGYQIQEKHLMKETLQSKQVIDEKNQKIECKNQLMGKKQPLLGSRMKNDRQLMINQNVKMKKQILQLLNQTEKIVEKNKKVKQYGIHLENQDSPEIKEANTKLKKETLRIMELKNKIVFGRRQLEFVYDSTQIQAKENQIKQLKAQLAQLQYEKKGWETVLGQQNKGIDWICDKDFEEKLKNTEAEITKIKEQCKLLAEDTSKVDKKLRKTHQENISRQLRVKELDTKQRSQKRENGDRIVTVEMLEAVENEIKKLQLQKFENDEQWKEKLRKIDEEFKNRKSQEQKKLLILGEKEKEVRLSYIKLKELKKYHELEKVKKEATETKKDDLREYRNKRNIKYLPK